MGVADLAAAASSLLESHGLDSVVGNTFPLGRGHHLIRAVFAAYAAATGRPLLTTRDPKRVGAGLERPRALLPRWPRALDNSSRK